MLIFATFWLLSIIKEYANSVLKSWAFTNPPVTTRLIRIETTYFIIILIRCYWIKTFFDDDINITIFFVYMVTLPNLVIVSPFFKENVQTCLLQNITKYYKLITLVFFLESKHKGSEVLLNVKLKNEYSYPAEYSL